MSNHKNLVWFNKEGDYLNFNYNDVAERFEGNIIFHENSTDTFRTYGLYMLEKLPAFEYELPGELTVDKFQLFNELGLHMYGAKYESESYTKIEPINNDSNFYSKWIYGDNFEKKFPVGTLIRFDVPFLEFTDVTQTYAVVSSKKGAIMIISQMDNDTFETTYFETYGGDQTELDNPSPYVGKTITGLNAIGVYDYVNSQYLPKISPWSEPFFYDKYYVNKKLNLINTGKQVGDEISRPPLYSPVPVTIKSVDLADQVHFEYSVSKTSLPPESNLIIEVLTRMDLPKIYEGGIEITGDGRINISFTPKFPQTIKPGKEIKIINSQNNSNFLTVANIPRWDGIFNETFFATQSQVIFNNKIYECIQAYTQSFGQAQTSSITPLNNKFWSLPTYIPVEQTTVQESILFAQIYYTTDKYYYEMSYTQSAPVTMASAVEKYAEDLKIFNIDLYYKNNRLRADLMYPSNYAIVNFYHTAVGPTYSIGSFNRAYEKLIQTKEQLNYELNYNFSENFSYNIVFTDLDEFGLKIIINGMVYEEEIAYVYSGATLDMERTIDKTLRRWLVRNYLRLYVLGIRVELKYVGNYTSIFYNAIIVKTQYPNVPMVIDRVEVGTAAKFHIEHSKVTFNSGSYSIPYVNVKINGEEYITESVYYASTNVVDIPTTLQNWVNAYSEELALIGYLITNINYVLKFDVTQLEVPLNLSIITGRVNLPGLQDYTLVEKIKGNHGMLIASNQIMLPEASTASFESEGFATGRVISINNTVFPWNNQEYNVTFLDPHVMNISYQGPFWGLTDSICSSSAYVTLAFDTGFGQTACALPVAPTGGTGNGAPFSIDSFSPGFSITVNPNNYEINNLDLSGFVGSGNLVDIKYVQVSNSIYAFGDGVNVIDSNTGLHYATIEFTGNTQSIEMEFNPINNYIYCLSAQQINVIDPTSNLLVSNISLTASYPGSLAFDMQINPVNGDVYISYSNSPRLDIWSYTNLSSLATDIINSLDTNFPLLATRTGKMVFNNFENDLYVTTDANQVLRINSNRTIQTAYGIPGLTHSLFYEPVNESIYVFSNTSIWKIDNGLTQSITLASDSFNDIIFNNLTGQINISGSSGNFTELDLSSNIYNQDNITDYGYLEINQYDGDVYLSSQVSNKIVVINTQKNSFSSQPMTAQTTKIVYNPDRESIWALQPSNKSLVEIKVELLSTINIISGTYTPITENQYGTLDPNYKPRPSMWLKAREFFRKPRENYEGDVSVQYYYKWLTDDVNEFFIYDFSGDQLPITGSYAYTGPKPLDTIVLNKKPNVDVMKVNLPEYQQTIFNSVNYKLSYIDDEDDFSTEIEPLQLFLGFNSPDEGVKYSQLLLWKKEDVELTINSNSNNYVTFESIFNINDTYGIIKLNEQSTDIFTGKGFKPGQRIVIYLKDLSNSKNQYTSPNHASLFIIREVYTRQIVVSFLSDLGVLIPESTIVNNYPVDNSKTYLKFTIKVLDREIGRFLCYGQTEEEDERFKIELGNIGKLINPDEVFIFKEYDILEGGIDWTILNRKRKEMLMMKHLIYPYIGSYKAIINAINYFGFNDLILNEYFRDIDPKSPNYDKNYKVKIPDIFDNTIDGWTDNEYIKNTFPNERYEETNSFNLSYLITDEEGNNVLNYSLDEVIIKLQGLKYWLKRNVIPLTHKIIDITGQAYQKNTYAITHQVIDTKIVNMKEEMCPVTFKLNEAYLMPVNSGSTVYNCVLDFYSIVPNIGFTSSQPGPPPEIEYDRRGNGYLYKPYNGAKLITPDYFDIKIRTYKTYKEWKPFLTYMKGDKITYYGKLYESVIDNNRVKNPRRFENVAGWTPNISYSPTSLVEYRRNIYVYSGLSASSVPVSPNLDALNWLNITEWKLIDLEPVQTITEWRSGDDILPFNFTIDSNIDPYLVIEVTSDNGYGQIYTDRKNYEIRGIKDLQEPYSYIEPIGPFNPIKPVY